MRLYLLLVLSIACSGTKQTDTATNETNDTNETDDTNETESSLLDDCQTNIDSDVPEFYQMYFTCVDIEMNGDAVVITSDGLPPHLSYYYGQGHEYYTEFDTSGERSEYSPNPNTIASQNHSLEIPANPVSKNLTIDASLVDGAVNSSSDEYGMGTVGLALDGVSIFNSLAAPGDVIENEVFSFDSYNAHAEMSGNYHYHTDTMGPLEVLQHAGYTTSAIPGEGEIEVYGMMCDGTIVMGCTELDGSAPTTDDFDAQNGHLHDLTDLDGTTHFTNRYHTHICTGSFTNFLFTPEIQYYNTCNN